MAENDGYRFAATFKKGAYGGVQLFDGHRHGEDFVGLVCSVEL
jgi:hypothetical protein